ncbi:TonB-dependent receptor [Salinimicrobium flavum]|uniref:TonB-dependent receptor n=1 Tax=Salinimicrobium flavum TaxID=1737065 RepID=A0ABW5IW93_9FLAO
MRKFLALAFFLTSATIFAQTTLTGKVVEAETNTPIPGVNIGIKQTTVGTVTDFDGNFTIETARTQGVLVLSYVGFTSIEVPFTGSADLGTLSMEPSAFGLDEVVVTSFSLAIDRKTPVAVSTIQARDIETKLGSQEFPEILKSTPGVYATKNGGGFGDAELRLRGFNSENIAVMINGIPVNDMENGRVYWSNWAGLSDVTRSMQVQRGLGASKVAVPSIGGTVNIVTKTTDMEEGGNVMMRTGNDGYQKFGFTLSTGKFDNGFAATIAASRTTGNGFVDGTEFEGYSYFINLAKEFGEDHQLSFTAFGAPQWHGQRQNSELIETFRESDRGIKFNRDWGYLNGEVTHVEDNFYHKPQMSLNHYWNISDATNLSTAAYASFGTGGGGGYGGVNKFGLGTESAPSPYRNGYLQPLNLDKIVDENIERGALGAETYLRASRNNHNWYGVLSTLSTEVTEDIEFMGGVDLRYYKGEHFTELTNLLGGQYLLDTDDENNKLKQVQVGDKIDYYDEGFVLWEGAFAQAEYSRNELSAFISVAASNTSYKRKDYFNYKDNNPLRETDYQHFFGYSAKGGANFNLDANNNIFANIGYFEKAPGFDAVFLNYQNDINDDAENQKIFSAELGYGYRSANFRANVNIYRTEWNDRTLTQSFRNADGTFGSANILGVNALHQGIEVDLNYRPFDKLTLTGMASIGDWTWVNDVTDVQIFNEEQQLIRTIDLFIADLKVGDAAQTTFALGADYEAFEGTNVRLDFNYFDNLFADFDPNFRNTEGVGQAWEVPAYGILDFGLTHDFTIGGFDAMFLGNVNNILGTEYIADARDGGMSSARTATVYYGFGRTYTVGAKINF